jgi:ankyrin repeat protein
VFVGLKEERIAREREIEKQEAINKQLRNALYESPPSLDNIRTLVEACRGALSFVDRSGRIPLHHACDKNQPSLEVVRYLVEEYPESLQVTNTHGNLPLHRACANQAALDVVWVLVQKYPKSLQVTNNDGYLFLHYACTVYARHRWTSSVFGARVPRVDEYYRSVLFLVLFTTGTF